MVDELVKQFGFKERTEAVLSKANIQAVPMVPAPPVLVADLHTVPDATLGSIYGQFESYAGWVNYCLTRRNCDLATALTLQRRLESKLYLELKTKDKTDKVVKCELDANTECIMYENEIAQIQTDVEMLKAILRDAEGKAKALSRELTSRTGGTNLRRNDFNSGMV